MTKTQKTHISREAQFGKMITKAKNFEGETRQNALEFLQKELLFINPVSGKKRSILGIQKEFNEKFCGKMNPAQKKAQKNAALLKMVEDALHEFA